MGALKLITQRDLIRDLAKRWAEQYGSSYWKNDEEKQSILRKLEAADLETATAADIEAVIGNNSWTTLECDVCDLYVDAVVQCGDEPDYESSTANMCRACAIKAAEMLE